MFASSSRLLCALPLLLSLTACGLVKEIIHAETEQSGGVVGHYADKVFPVAGKKLQIYRAAMAMALISGGGAVIITRDEDAWDYVYAVQRAAQEINFQYGMVTAQPICDGDEPYDPFDRDQICLFYPAASENYLPILEGKFFKLAVASLPRDKFDELKDDLISQAYLSFAVNLASLLGDLALAGHQMAATSRSMSENIAWIVLSSESLTDAQKQAALRILDSTEAAKAILRSPEGQRYFGGQQTFAPGAKLADILASEPPPGFSLGNRDFDFLFKLTYDFCKQVARRADWTGSAEDERSPQSQCNDVRFDPDALANIKPPLAKRKYPAPAAATAPPPRPQPAPASTPPVPPAPPSSTSPPTLPPDTLQRLTPGL